MRIPNWFSLNGSRASVQKIRGVIRPQAHHWAREESRTGLQLRDPIPGKANNTPRALQTRIAAIHRTHRFFIPKLYNTGRNAVQDAWCRCPAESRTHTRRNGLARLFPFKYKNVSGLVFPCQDNAQRQGLEICGEL